MIEISIQIIIYARKASFDRHISQLVIFELPLYINIIIARHHLTPTQHIRSHLQITNFNMFATDCIFVLLKKNNNILVTLSLS